MRRSLKLSLLACLAATSLAACAKLPVTVDTPMDGAKVAVGLGQEMLVNWPNMHPKDGAWQLEGAPPKALSAAERKVQPAQAGGQQIETFRFTGSAAGRDTLTFVYRHADGQAPTPEERIALAVTVS